MGRGSVPPVTDPNPWTLDRVEREVPDLAPLARLHRTLEDAGREVERRGLPVHPALAGAPAVHWVAGTPLLDAADPAALAGAVPHLAGALAVAAASVVPSAAGALAEIRALCRPDAPVWGDVLAGWRDPAGFAAAPHRDLFRFLVLRALSFPARHLARSLSAPHPDRWKRPDCPWCGVRAAASVGRAGAGRTLLCVLCGGRWEAEDTACTLCGERDLRKFRVLANRDLGPATIEACTGCHGAVKVFSSPDLVWGPPLAVEVLTVRLDHVAERDEGVRRDATSLAALFPPG